VIRRALLVWGVNVIALLVADWLIEGIHIDDQWRMIVAGGVFALVNWLVKPVVQLLALPLIILTLGIALFFVNLLMLYITAWLVAGFDIDSFWSAVGGTIVIWAVNGLLQAAFGLDDRRRS
jgi:putative membrane protein